VPCDWQRCQHLLLFVVHTMELESGGGGGGGGYPRPERLNAEQLQERLQHLVGQGRNALEAEHGYTRSDASGGAVLSQADEFTLHKLLLERLYAKKTRDFDVADQLRDQLKEAGCHISDRDNTYSIRAPRSEPTAMPTQHEYTRADDGAVPVAPADQVTLDALLLERIIAKRQRDFTKADAVREQLRAAGVLVDDKAQTYRVVPPRGQPAPMPTHHGYTRVDDGAVAVAPADQVILEQLLYQRVCAKHTRDWTACDQLREQLKQAGVHLDDKTLTYRVLPPRGQHAPMPTHHGYTRVDDGSVAVLPAGQVTLDRLLLERVCAKRRRDYSVCDQLRDQLKENGVYLDDKTLTYRVTDPARASAPWIPMQGPQVQMPTEHGYTRTDDGSVVIQPADQATLDHLLLERVCAKKRRDWPTADQVREQLREAGCFVDDQSQTYRIVDRSKSRGGGGAKAMPTEHDYSRSDDGTAITLTPEQQATVDRLLLERICAKRRREFDTADQLREELKQLGVLCDDATKTYSMVDPNGIGGRQRADLSSDEPYTRDPADDSGVPLAPEDEAMLLERLAARRAAQRIRDYAGADAIREELRQVALLCECMLFIDDSARTFRFASKRSRREPQGDPDAHNYSRKDEGDVAVTAETQAAIDKMLLERIVAKRSRDFNRADEVRSELTKIGVFIDDKGQTYAIRPLSAVHGPSH
jgi:cysteinyl-tRNA synthetase